VLGAEDERGIEEGGRHRSILVLGAAAFADSLEASLEEETNVQQKQAVVTSAAPPAAHAFSQGVRKGPLLQVSGQGPADPETGEFLHPGDVAGQTTRVLQNVLAVLAGGGASFDDLVMLRVYLTDREHFAAMNDAYGGFVAEHSPSGVLPARTTVFTGLPHAAMLVEIDGLAVVE
jgi:reactive intermediate/imine deaminase